MQKNIYLIYLNVSFKRVILLYVDLLGDFGQRSKDSEEICYIDKGFQSEYLIFVLVGKRLFPVSSPSSHRYFWYIYVKGERFDNGPLDF